MRLKVKFLSWSAGIPVAMLHKEVAEHAGVHTQGRILIKTCSKNPKELIAIVDVVEDKLVGKKEVALSSEIRKRMKLRKGQIVEISLFQSTQSLELIKKKLKNNPLTEKEIDQIIADIVNNSLSDPEVALFVSAMYQQGMSQKETISLIKAILKTGNKLPLRRKYIVDKHCIGGIPGNRTTPIVVAICAAAGLTFPKSSSRAITSAAGTADVIETIARVDFSIKEIQRIVEKTNACLVWGGALGLVPADSKIIQMEKALKLDPEAQLLASITSKKLAVGSNYVLIDIPYGKTAKVTRAHGLSLKRRFEALGKYFKIKIHVVLTKGDGPVGRGVGPNLEMKDLLKVLDQTLEGPCDLEEKSLFLAGEILEMAKKAKKGKGIEMATEILHSGKAFKKFKEIIRAQKGKIVELPCGEFCKEILAKKDAKVLSMDNKGINNLARVAGCPTDNAAGVYLDVKPKEKVRKGEVLITIYAESESRLKEAIKFYKKTKPIQLN
ncbi:thymidine phosphorylase family protein [archaeon]|jgi:AMP phosphorylase|nr:thymidine phosphorylase family protein [archaeon]